MLVYIVTNLMVTTNSTMVTVIVGLTIGHTPKTWPKRLGNNNRSTSLLCFSSLPCISSAALKVGNDSISHVVGDHMDGLILCEFSVRFKNLKILPRTGNS